MRSFLRQVQLLSVFAVVAFGVAAIQLIPSWELSKASVRSSIDYATSTLWSLPPVQLVSLFVPGFFGRGPADYWGPWLRTAMGYVGVLTLVAGLIAVAFHRRRIMFFFLILAVLSLALSLGGRSVPQGWLYTLGWGFDKVRAPSRFLYLFDFALAGLAGLGIDRLLSPLKSSERRAMRGITRFLTFVLVVLAVGSLLPFLYWLTVSTELSPQTIARFSGISEGLVLFVVLLALSIALLWARLQNWAKPGVLGVFAVVLILFDLMTTGSNLEVGKKDPTVNFQHPGVINFLQQDKSLYRIDTVTDVWDVWQPDTSVMYGVFDIMGIYNPMLLNDLDRYWAELGGRSNSRYDLLNAKYLIGHKGVPLDRKKFELVYDEDPKVSVFRNNNVLPRAFVVYGADIVENNDAALQAIHDPNFDPKRRVVLSEGKSSSSGLDPSEAVVDKYSLNELVVKASAAAPGYLVLSEVYYDGWQAWVDGQPEKVLRANYLFRAVPLPSGEHEIRLVFNPPSFRYGAILSGITWLALIVWGAIGLVRRRGLGRPSS